MKLTIVLLVVWAAIPLPAQHTLRIAAVQMTSADHDIERNLGRATAFAEFPEFAALVIEVSDFSDRLIRSGIKIYVESSLPAA